MEAEVTEIRSLAARQRDYARAVLVGVAGEARAAETRRDDVTRAERQAKTALEQVEAESVAAADERRTSQDRVDAIGVERDALKDRDAYRDGAALADLRAQGQRLRQLAQRAANAAIHQETGREAAATELEGSARQRDTAVANLVPAGRELEAAAAHVGAEGVAVEAALAEPDDGERLVTAWAEAKRSRVAEIRASLAAHTGAVQARTYVEQQVTVDEETVDKRLAARTERWGAEAAAVAAYRGEVEEWAGASASIGPARVLGFLPRPVEEPGAVAEAVTALALALGAEEAVARRNLAAERQVATGERDGLVEERARWAESGLVNPDPPPWRSPRLDRPGAPLWRLVDVAPGVAPADVDGLEAALTGVGLLDAWVQPDGAVDLGDDRADLVLGVRPVGDRTLSELLVPAGGFAAGVVAAVLASVAVARTADTGHGANDVVVATDGTFRLGAAVGRGPRRPALLLGAVARERHRLERLAEVDAALAAVDALIAGFDRAEAGLDRHRAAVDAELAAMPSGAPVDEARRALADAAARLDEAEERLHRTRAALTEAEGQVRHALRILTAAAAQHSLPTSPEGLDEVEAGLRQLAQAARTWARRRRERADAERHHARDARRLADAEEAAVRARTDQLEAEHEASAVEGRCTALESTIGAEYGQLLQRLTSLEQERTSAQRRERELAVQLPNLERRVGTLAGELSAAEAARHQAEEDRARAQRRFVAVLTSLADDAGVEAAYPLDTPSAVLAAARAVAAAHERVETDARAVERLSERVRERVHLAQAALGARVDLARELAEAGWWVLRTMEGGIRRGVAELAATLAAQMVEGRAELAAEEERLFEQTLAGSVRRALAERIRMANRLVDGINHQLVTIRTLAGGLQVRLRWEVDPDQLDAVKAARALLLRDPADLSDGERASLQAFVRARVDQARAELERNAPWEARLRETLDYRAWHRFTLQLAHRDWEGFQPATAKRLQKLSTGERSIALHLPMIASVAAHYANDAGDPSGCPRLILLDELFAGVDTANRAQLFGTFSTWDLDAVFTSDHEWCQYATLDGIAIHHLHPPHGDEPVTSTRFTWDGHRRTTDPPAA